MVGHKHMWVFESMKSAVIARQKKPGCEDLAMSLLCVASAVYSELGCVFSLGRAG